MGWVNMLLCKLCPLRVIRVIYIRYPLIPPPGIVGLLLWWWRWRCWTWDSLLALLLLSPALLLLSPAINWSRWNVPLNLMQLQLLDHRCSLGKVWLPAQLPMRE
jgi:hypothetical protein